MQCMQSFRCHSEWLWLRSSRHENPCTETAGIIMHTVHRKVLSASTDWTHGYWSCNHSTDERAERTTGRKHDSFQVGWRTTELGVARACRRRRWFAWCVPWKIVCQTPHIRWFVSKSMNYRNFLENCSPICHSMHLIGWTETVFVLCFPLLLPQMLLQEMTQSLWTNETNKWTLQTFFSGTLHWAVLR